MADIRIQYTCGCGFITRDIEDATDHVEKTEHTMTALGNIMPDKKEPDYLRPRQPRTF